jgi:CcmD family protein
MLLSLLLQEGPADTTSYMIAGYAVIFVVMLLYLISLFVRQRNLQKDLEVFEEIQADQE